MECYADSEIDICVVEMIRYPGYSNENEANCVDSMFGRTPFVLKDEVLSMYWCFFIYRNFLKER